MIILMLLCLYKGMAQQNNKDKKQKTNAPKKVAIRPTIYLGHSDFAGGKISVGRFNTLLKQGINAHDSLGNKYNIIGFYFNYAERKLYEDSAGEALLQFDLLREFCPGDTISSTISESIYDRVKRDDTVFFDQVMLTKIKPGQRLDTFLGKDMKCAITK